jgi:tetratricopeptide (TPR) repeat protein
MSKKNKSKKSNAPKTLEQAPLKLPVKPRIYNRLSVHMVLIAIIGMLAYSNTFSVPFMFDDKAPNGQIEDNLMIRDLGNFILALKGHDFSGKEGYIFVPRRFMGYLTFALDYKIHGLNVAGYHIVNLAVHIINALLVYLLVLLTFRTRFISEARGEEKEDKGRGNTIALFSALLFVSHPIQTESVTYIVQRFTSLATMFYLLSLLTYIKGRLSPQRPLYAGCWLLFSVLFALLAMLTKEISFTLPLVILLYELVFFVHTRRRRLLLAAVTGVIVVGSAVLVLGANGKSLGDMLSDLGRQTRLETNVSRWDYLMTETRVITTYVRLLLWPTNQNLDYDYPVSHSLFDYRVLLSFTFLFFLFALGLYLATDNLKRRGGEGRGTGGNPFGRLTVHESRLIGFGILWFFVTLSVESSIIPIADVINEHRMYLPSIGAFIALTQFYFVFIAKRNARFFSYASAFLLAIVLIFAVATFRRNMVWQNGVTMWEDVVKKSPLKARALNNLAAADIALHRFKAARDYLKRSLEADPGNVDVSYNLAYVYTKMGAYEDALALCRRVLESDPNNARILSQVATAQIQAGNYDAAKEAALKAISINPASLEAYIDLGVVYRKLGQYDAALGAAKEALRIKPRFALAYNNMGLAYVEMKRFNEAFGAFKRSLEIDPSYTEAYNNLGGLFIVQKNYDAAIDVLKRAVATDQDYVSAQLNLGIAYALKGERKLAMEQYAVVNRVSPQKAERLLGIIEKVK